MILRHALPLAFYCDVELLAIDWQDLDGSTKFIRRVARAIYLVENNPRQQSASADRRSMHSTDQGRFKGPKNLQANTLELFPEAS